MSTKDKLTAPKLKRARGWLLRAIRTGLVPPPPGYMNAEQINAAYDRADERRAGARKAGAALKSGAA